MLPLILSIIISQSTYSDTILVKGIREIEYRAFVFQDTLYFQYKTNYKWSDPIVLDKGNVSSPSMAISSGGHLHIVWCKQGKVYYITTLEPITKNSIKQNLNPQWSWKMVISTVNPFTEPASNPIVQLYDDKVFVTWQCFDREPINDREVWRHWKYVSDPFNECFEPENQSNEQKFNDLSISPLLSIPNSDSSIFLKRIVFLSPGERATSGYILCGDTDNDSLNELIFSTSDVYISLQVWEYLPVNRYELVWQAIGGQPPPPGGILTGNFRPNDIGDIDRDGLPDLVGPNQEWVNYSKTTSYAIVSTQESPDSFSHPETLSWYQRISFVYNSIPSYFTDLDSDSAREILTVNDSGIAIFENVSNNQNSLVWNRFNYCSYFTFDDFDLDERKEFVTASPGSMGNVFLFENVGPDSYELIYQDTVQRPNGTDVFSGRDLDGDGKPEFYIGFAQSVGGSYYDIYLYMWESTGNNMYEKTLIDVLRIHNFTSVQRRSICADLDGDGIEELIWSTLTNLLVYKATSNNQFQRVWEWQNDHAAEIEDGRVNVYDMNKNGYNEIIFFGNGKISIFEVEAVRLLSPNGGQNFLPGDSVLIQWQKFTPPRCDSFSLSYTTDNGITYLPILSSIPSTESTYNWIVPNTPSESCLIKVTAYGPGTQFDESDALFTIQPIGISETQLDINQPLRLDINPNPFKTKTIIRLNKPAEKLITFKIYNSSGKLVKTLTLYPKQSAIAWDGTNEQAKSLPNGVYILKLESENLELIEKLIITR